MIPELLPSLCVAGIFLGTTIFWIRWYFTKQEPRIRQWVGKKYGVEIRQGGKGHWQIVGKVSALASIQLFFIELGVMVVIGAGMPLVILLGLSSLLFLMYD